MAQPLLDLNSSSGSSAVSDVIAPHCSATGGGWHAAWQAQCPDRNGVKHWWGYDAADVVGGLEQAQDGMGLYLFAWREPGGSPIMYEADLLRGYVSTVCKDKVRELRGACVQHPPPSGPVRLGDIGPTTNILWQVVYERRGAL